MATHINARVFQSFISTLRNTCRSRKAVTNLQQQIRHKGGNPKLAGSNAKEKVQRIARKKIRDPFIQSNLTGTATDDVWLTKYYARKSYPIEECILRHKEYAAPEMLDNMDGFIIVEWQLDFRTKKKTKFMHGIKDTIVLPHNFDDGTENRIMAFCKTIEDVEKATELGAEFVGGTDLVKTVEKGEIKSFDYDHVICTLDMLPELGSIRKPLRDHFPQKRKGNLGDNVEELMKKYIGSKSFESLTIEESRGLLECRIGTVSMSVEQLVENYNTYVEDICTRKKSNLGRFITKGLVTCPPSPEVFEIQLKDCLPMSQRSNSKEVELEQEEEPEAIHDVESDDESAVKQSAKH